MSGSFGLLGIRPSSANKWVIGGKSLVSMVSIPPPGGRGVLPEIPLKLSNSGRTAAFRLPSVDHAGGRRMAYAACFLPVWDLNRRTGVFLSRRAARRRALGGRTLSH